ncbi:MAG: GNAT family protein [Actinomycetota bacterium]
MTAGPQFDLGEDAEVRPFEPDDAWDLFAVVDAERERLRVWLPWVDRVLSVEDERAWLESVVPTGGNLGGLGIFVAGQVAGGIGLRRDASGVSGDIGYWLSKDYEGHGLVTRASRILIEHAFSQLGLHRITIHAAPDNARSRAIPDRLGFTREGVLREAERTGTGYRDLVVYGLLEREWRARP